ncbi:hypothetical protein ABZ413_29680 [Nocardia rhamnosiphila]|uniref:hypothetical protein n=1 Tax=Nocardia rhamnosiphila TaxID=426716 RepID=UPI0033F4690A
MTTEYYIKAATTVLGFCQTRNLWFPNIGDTTILGWATDFEESKLAYEDLMAGVQHAYKECDGEFRPKPIDIIRAARAARSKMLADLPKAKRDLMTEANHLLQDMDFTPNQAARISQAWALDQGSPVSMTAEQYAEFLRRMETKKQELANREPRELESIWNLMREWDPFDMESHRKRRDQSSDDDADDDEGPAAAAA